MQSMVVMFKFWPFKSDAVPIITCQSKLNKTSPRILRLFIFLMNHPVSYELLFIVSSD